MNTLIISLVLLSLSVGVGLDTLFTTLLTSHDLLSIDVKGADPVSVGCLTSLADLLKERCGKDLFNSG